MHRFLFILLAGTLMSAPAQAGIVVFGDSLSDTGNLFTATGGGFPFNGVGPGGRLPQFPTPPYAERFTNGPTWIEHFAAGRGMSVDPSLLGGTNFAFGGAESGDGVSVRGTPNVGAQIEMFQLSGQTLEPDTLISLWIGSNDFNNGGFPPQPASNVVENIVKHITDLQGLGGQRFMIPNLPDLGQTPAALAAPPGFSEILTLRSVEFNRLLGIELESLRTGLGIQVIEVDVFETLNSVLADPTAFGFTNTTGTAFNVNAFQAAFEINPNVDGNLFLVSNPNEYVFLDGVHPTAEFHQVLGSAAAIAAVPEPTSAAAWGLFMVIGAGIRRRRRNRALPQGVQV